MLLTAQYLYQAHPQTNDRKTRRCNYWVKTSIHQDAETARIPNQRNCRRRMMRKIARIKIRQSQLRSTKAIPPFSLPAGDPRNDDPKTADYGVERGASSNNSESP